MSVQSFINFNGNCRKAVEFYAKIFGTEEPLILSYGEIPPNQAFPIAEEVKDLVMHARLNIKGNEVMFSDVVPGMPYVTGNNISLTIISNSKNEIKYFFNKLKEGGRVAMELQETFLSKCYGSLIDKFGIAWNFNYESEQNPIYNYPANMEELDNSYF